MCGILAILQRSDAEPSTGSLRASAERLSHRGPDAHGIFATRGAGFAHTRLSLLDPDPRSNQPFFDDTRRYVLAYNGEVYNFRELRAALEARGVAFHTTSDTEVVLQCLIHHAPDEALRLFDGMFALAFYDTVTETLVAARDRFGMKPLYCLEGDGACAVASEVKAFGPWTTLRADASTIGSYLLGSGGPMHGPTFFAGVRSLEPGTLIVARRGEPLVARRWAAVPEFLDADRLSEARGLSPAKTVDMLEQQLYEAVGRQLVSDATVGAFCSGGVDSSLLVAMAARQHSDLAIFHANVVGRWSELSAAKTLAAHLKLDLHTVDVRDADLLSSMPDAARQYEQPYTYHPNCVPFMLVARLARDTRVKALLSGEGSDELFLGYPWLWRQPFVDALMSRLGPAGPLLRRLPVVGTLLGPKPGVRRGGTRDLSGEDELAIDAAVRDERLRAMPADLIDRHHETTLTYMGHHLRSLLHRNDTLGMQASLESRFPFLDHAVVRSGINMPSSLKLRPSLRVFEKAHPFVRDKWVVREVARRWMPDALAQRIKIGFWTTAFARTRVDEAYFPASHLPDLLELPATGVSTLAASADDDLRLRLFHLDVWAAVCLHGEEPGRLADRISRHVRIVPE